MELNLSDDELMKIAVQLKPFLEKLNKKHQQQEAITHPEITRWLTTPEFRKKLPRRKNDNWIREVLLSAPKFQKYVDKGGADRGRGHAWAIDPKLLHWIDKHPNRINWKAKNPAEVYLY